VKEQENVLIDNFGNTFDGEYII